MQSAIVQTSMFKQFSSIVPSSAWRIIRFLIAGGLATTVSTTVLHISVAIFHLWYVLGSVLGFFAGFFISFTLQKYWTFRDSRGSDVMKKQAAMYFVLLGVNLASNTLFVFIGVEYGHLPPVAAQILTSLIIAVQNFLVYRFIIFRPAKVSTEIKKGEEFPT